MSDLSRALMIEDMEDTRELLIRLMSGSHRVTKGEIKFSQAATFEEGDLVIQQGGIDLVLLDLSLPPYPARDTAMKFAARRSAWPATIIVTGNEDDDMRRLCIGSGACDYWDKDLALHTPPKALIERAYNAYLLHHHGR